MALGDGTAWDETTPTNATNLSDGDDHILDVRKGTRIRAEKEHATYAGSSGGGEHKFVTLQTQATKPTVGATQVAALYVKDVGAGVIELYYEDEAGNEIQVTSGSGLKNSIPTDYRAGMRVLRGGSNTTITVQQGFVEVNGLKVAKTTSTTLTLTTDADWAGGASLQATDTYAYVGIDASGNLKMHTTAPSHDDYAVSSTSGLKRYATWSGIVYRIIGWFYMNITGAGELDTYAVSSLRELDAFNQVHRVGTTDDTINDVAYGTDLTECVLHFYCTGRRPVVVVGNFLGIDASLGINNDCRIIVDFDGSDDADSETMIAASSSTNGGGRLIYMTTALTEGTHTVTLQAKVGGSSDLISNKVMDVYEL